MSNLTVRVLFALVAGPSFLALLWWGGWSRWALMSLLCILGAWEFARMVRLRWGGPNLDVLAPVAVAGSCFLLGRSAAGLDLAPLLDPLGVSPLFLLDQGSGALGLAWIAIVFLSLIAIAFARVETEEIFPWLARHLFGILFLGVWMVPSFWLLGTEPGWQGVQLFLFVVVAMWVSDTGAYFTGRTLGKHKLCPGISPKKTIEGAVGGLVWTLVYAAIVRQWWRPNDSWTMVLLLALVLGVTAQLGDLLESTVKRAAQIKDSSNLLPGHGGILDRFDSLFLAAPVAAAFVQVWDSFSAISMMGGGMGQ
jgi:phosphatidate cytidylyltransferase